MLASLLHIALLGLLFLCMAAGVLMTVGGAYSFTIYKGRTSAARKLDIICVMHAVVGVALFITAAAHFATLVMR